MAGLSRILIVAIILLSVNELFAKSMWRPNLGPAPFPIQVKVIRTFGDGCPDGSVSAAMTPDQTSISLLFDQLLTDVPASSPLTRKSCNVTLGIRFNGQYRVAIVGSDVNGFVHVPAGASSRISVKHWSIYDPGQRNAAKMNVDRNFVGPAEQNVSIQTRFSDVPLWSQCGTQFISSPTEFPFMTINLEINSVNGNPSENLLAAIDSLDMSSNGLTYQVAWTVDRKSCPK